MRNNIIDARKGLIKKIEQYYAFTSFLDYLLSNVETNDDSSSYDKSLYTCFNAFVCSSSTYLLSVYEDLKNDNYDFLPKANANRLLLRNCLEANLILNILINKPELAEKYYNTKASDNERIDMLYSDDEQQKDKKFLKRFSWLPRIKGVRAKTMSDLLKYVDFENEQQRNEYNIIIKNFDTFIHPSFNLVKAVNAELNSGSIDGVIALFTENGIYYDLIYNLLNLFIEAYKDKFNPSVFNILNDILIVPSYNSFYFPVDKKELLTLPYDDNTKISILTGIYSTFSIEKDYNKLEKLYPSYIGSISYTLSSLATYISISNKVSYKVRNIVFLLKDLTPRYDDMLKATYEKSEILFYTQARYVVESLSIIITLLNNDDERNKMYALHQRIKGYEAHLSATRFIKENSNDYASLDELDIILQQDKDIETLSNYYKNKYNLEVERRNLERLNGWALNLDKINNEKVPNSPFFVDLMCDDVYYDKDSKYIASALKALFEESNAFTHVTPYAYSKGKELSDLMTPLLIINDLTSKLIDKLFNIYKLEDKLNKEQINEVQLGFKKAIEEMKKDYKNT